MIPCRLAYTYICAACGITLTHDWPVYTSYEAHQLPQPHLPEGWQMVQYGRQELLYCDLHELDVEVKVVERMPKADEVPA